MCGIAGFVGLGTVADLRRMTTQLFHRGPDAEGLWYDANQAVYLGHRRLSILDMAGGSQPMWTSDGTLGIVFNGEIYNHLELRRLRPGRHRYRGRLWQRIAETNPRAIDSHQFFLIMRLRLSGGNRPLTSNIIIYHYHATTHR